MQLLSHSTGEVLFEGRFKTIRRCVEAAIADNANLTGVSLRKANLRHANLDGAIMPKASFWGADISYANMAEGNFENSDFRASKVKETCLAGSQLSASDCVGAYFNNTILGAADLSAIRFSCPSFFSLDLNAANTLEDITYLHKGEIACPISHPPLVIKGLQQDIIFMDNHVKLGDTILSLSDAQPVLTALKEVIGSINTTISNLWVSDYSHSNLKDRAVINF